jgi:hypothetical protein
MAVVDTAASLTTGNLWFFTWLAKKFPGCVVAVYTSETHSPITLTGIVKSDSDGTKTSTELPVCFVFSLPYSMNDGTPTNLAVACGPDVSVNLILGLPFIAATQMVIDVAENVVECRALDCSPFPIENKRARVEVPKVEVPDSPATHAYEAFVQDIEALESHWACLYTTDSTTGKRLDSKKTKVAASLGDNGYATAASKAEGDDEHVHRVAFALPPNGVRDAYADPALAMGAEDSDDDE